MAEKRRDKSDDDVMHGRSFAGASYGANEQEQTRDRERVVKHAEADESGETMITDAEMEVREANSSEDESDS